MQKRVPISGKIGFILPVLAGCLMALSPFSHAAHRLPWSQLPPVLALGATVGVLAWVIFYALPLTRNASSVISCVATLVVMLWMVFPYPIMPVMIVLSTIIVLYDLNKSHLRVITSIALTVVLLTIIVSVGQTAYTKTVQVNADQSELSVSEALAQTPDIYFIVPDRFTNPDGLRDCGFNPDEFVEALTSRGFYVRNDAMSSDSMEAAMATRILTTTRTLRFLASTLNLGAEIELTIPYNKASSMVKNHAVGRILQKNSYVYHHIGDWWQETLCNPVADYNYIYEVEHSSLNFLSANELMISVVDRSWLRDINIGSVTTPLRVNASRNEYQLSTFKDIAGNGEHPKFVLLHILLPHPPYVWTADGDIQNSSNTAGLGSVGKYLAQAQFTMGYLLQMLDAIEDKDSIVIIQSDEGVAFTNLSSNEGLSSNQMDGVLTAWRIPGVGVSELDNVRVTDILGYVIESLKTPSQ